MLKNKSFTFLLIILLFVSGCRTKENTPQNSNLSLSSEMTANDEIILTEQNNNASKYIRVFSKEPCPHYSVGKVQGWTFQLNPVPGIDLALFPEGNTFGDAKVRILFLIKLSEETPQQFLSGNIDFLNSNAKDVRILKQDDVSISKMGGRVLAGKLQQVRYTNRGVTFYDQMITLSVKGISNSNFIFNNWISCQNQKCINEVSHFHKSLIEDSFVAYYIKYIPINK